MIAQKIVNENYKQNKSFTYDEAIDLYKQLDKKYKKAVLLEKGTTDVGKPLHVFTMYNGKGKVEKLIAEKKHPVLFILNGIHPGEPDGIDASLLFSEWILSEADSILKNTIICIIPVYNIDGSLNRNCCSRANQNGPEMYGFRGNAQNLDLNRDFIKMDSENATSFVKIFHWLNPDLMIDTHVSNGADYQYTFTLLTTLREQLEKNIGNYFYDEMIPNAYDYMKKNHGPIAPYINAWKEIPENGIVSFYDSPRFSSGFASLFNTPTFVTETHMLKSFPKRVEATLHFLKWSAMYMSKKGRELKNLRKISDSNISKELGFNLKWKTDESRFSFFNFLGYEAKYKKSEVTGLNRLYYDTNQPWQKDIKYYNYSISDLYISKPKYYIIPQSKKQVIERLFYNSVPLIRFQNDTVISVSAIVINSYESSSTPYEGHHRKTKLKLTEKIIEKKFQKGDYFYKTGSRYDYFMMMVLEPNSIDSYLSWGFFDSMFDQKEWFSDYVFEDIALELLNENEVLKQNFEKKKLEDEKFRTNAWEQLYYIYKHSEYFEKSYREYPIYKIE